MDALKLISLTNLSGNICHRSAIRWSEDNIISLCMEKGIHILIPVFRSFESTGFVYHRYFIPAPKQINQFDVDINRDNFHDKLSRDLLYTLMLDRTLSPAVASQQSYKGYRITCWSPKFGTLNNRCLLATLTMDHRLQLYVPLGASVEKYEDLSHLLQEYVKNKQYSDCTQPPVPEGNLSSAELLYYQLRQRVYTLAAINMVWTDLLHPDPSEIPFDQSQKMKWFHASEFSLLLVAMKSGHVVVWEIFAASRQEISCKILGLFYTELQIIESLAWVQVDNQSGLLTVGSSSGLIKMFLVKVSWNEEDTVITFKNLSMIWEDEDKLAVTEMGLKKVSASIYHLIAGKGSYLIGFELLFNTGEFTVKHQAVSVGSHLTSLTDIISIASDSFLVTSSDGCLQLIKLQTDPTEGLQITPQKITYEAITANKALMGITKSPSGILICSVGRLLGYFDHLAIKEPVDVTIFSLISLSDAVSLLLQHPQPLSNVRDFLIYIQYMIGNGENIPDEFIQLASLPLDKLQLQSTYILQIIRWLLKTRIVQNINEESSNLDEKLQFIDNELIKQRLYMSISSLDTNRIKETSVEMKMIVNFISEVLQAFFKLDTNELLMIQHVIASSAYLLSDARLMQENCPICKERRCCLTTRACFLPTYRKCCSCDALALKTVKSLERHLVITSKNILVLYDVITELHCTFTNKKAIWNVTVKIGWWHRPVPSAMVNSGDIQLLRCLWFQQ